MRNLIFLIIAVIGMTSCLNREFLMTDSGINQTKNIIKEEVIISFSTTKKDIRKKDGFKYYYFHQHRISSDTGNYLGDLLHGLYLEQDLKTRCTLTKGNYHYGLREGKWESFDLKGNQLSVTLYKNSVIKQEEQRSIILHPKSLFKSNNLVPIQNLNVADSTCFYPNVNIMDSINFQN